MLCNMRNRMEFIKSEKLKYEYSRFNEETNENESIEALKGLDITIDSGGFVACLLYTSRCV